MNHFANPFVNHFANLFVSPVWVRCDLLPPHNLLITRRVVLSVTLWCVWALRKSLTTKNTVFASCSHCSHFPPLSFRSCFFVVLVAIFDANIGFYVQNCICSQLEMSIGRKCGKHKYMFIILQISCSDFSGFCFLSVFGFSGRNLQF